MQYVFWMQESPVMDFIEKLSPFEKSVQYASNPISGFECLDSILLLY